MCLDGAVEAPNGGPELSTTDVDPRWLADQAITPEPPRPLSTAEANVYTCVEPGRLAGALEIPTVADDVTEPLEQIRIEAKIDLGSRTLPQTLTGHVTESNDRDGANIHPKAVLYRRFPTRWLSQPPC